MDDIRRPHQPQRRDYTMPPHRPMPPSPAHQPQPQPAPVSQPIHHQPAHHLPHPVHHDQAPTQTAAMPPHHQSVSQPVPHHQPVRPKARRRGLKVALIILLPFIAAGLFAAGYSLRSSKDSNGIPASITRQVKYDLYFPSPMPSGYIYMKNTATFQIGQVFYKFSNGNKRVTVNEQPIGQNKPDLSQLPGYEQLDSPVGKAALGSTFGAPTAVVVTPTTVITMNTAGGVSQAELKSAVLNLKNIGQKNNNG